MSVDKEAVQAAYEEVRDDSSETSWFVLGYEGKDIVVVGKGSDYDEFLELCQDDVRLYAYVRVVSGDEMSKRAKFVFVTWIGPAVSPLKKAKVSVDKAMVKTIVTAFAKEILADERKDLEYEKVLEAAKKAGGANYGTGQAE